MESGHVKCFDCNKTFLRMDSAKKHYKEMHIADKNDKKFICKFCNKEFEVQYSLKQHVRDIHGLPKQFNHEKQCMQQRFCS